MFTIGHSTRSLREFVDLLRAHRVAQLADVRTVPKSRRHPHFAAEILAKSLQEHGIAYRHFPGLGGLRRPRRDSTNIGWRNDSFRGYADYMQTIEFQRSLEELLGWAGGRTRDGVDSVPGPSPSPFTAIMCAEAVWWRCHRQLIADALVARGIEVRHIQSATSAPQHTLTDFARVDPTGRVSYPGLL